MAQTFSPIRTLLAAFCFSVSCCNLAIAVQPSDNAVPAISFEIIETQDHPADFFTQGLLVDGEWIYESSGGYGRSLLAKYKASNGSALTTKDLPGEIFAEGLTLLHESLYLLTWKKGRLYQFDKNWQLQATHRYAGEGWGLTNDGEQLIVSDGSDQLRFYQPEPFTMLHSVTVRGGGKRWDALNELEYVDGIIWANRWFSDEILAIDPSSGEVLGVLDFAKVARLFRQGKNGRERVLNGLAWSPSRQAMWVTGKHWNRRFLIKLPESFTERNVAAARR